MNFKTILITAATLLVVLAVAAMVDKGRVKGGKDKIFSA